MDHSVCSILGAPWLQIEPRPVYPLAEQVLDAGQQNPLARIATMPEYLIL